MAIKIITDSTCDLDIEVQKALDLEVVPLSVTFGDNTYKDGTELSVDEFYKMQAEAKELPTTSQVNPDEFVEVFEKYLGKGDTIIGIFLSSKLSGTYQSATIAKGIVDTNDNIYLIDSMTVTMGLGLLVREAAALKAAGKTAEEIHAEITSLVPRLEFIAIVATLKYLKMGGRVSAATAMVGGVLGISPVITVADGVVQSAGKVKGKKAKGDFLKQYVTDKAVDANYPIAFGHSRSLEETKELAEIVLATANCRDSFIDELGATIGTHAGPGCFGMAYIRA